MIKKAIDAIREAEEQAEVLCRVAAERADEMRAEVESEGTAHYNKITEDAQRYTADGLHFNDAGHEVLADCLSDFLKNL